MTTCRSVLHHDTTKLGLVPGLVMPPLTWLAVQTHPGISRGPPAVVQQWLSD